jgi:hypothetical protein
MMMYWFTKKHSAEGIEQRDCQEKEFSSIRNNQYFSSAQYK